LRASDNIVLATSRRPVALLGVHNLIVVRTPDALLICNRRDAERIKEIVGKLPPELQ
jgi:mannose-1-phosphate guanylyltransferase